MPVTSKTTQPDHKQQLEKFEEWGIGAAWRSQDEWRAQIEILTAENRRLRLERAALSEALLVRLREGE